MESHPTITRVFRYVQRQVRGGTHIDSLYLFVASQDNPAPSSAVVEKIINNIADYISAHSNSDPADIDASTKKAIVDQLRKKLDDSDLNINNDDLDAIQATVQVLLQTLPLTINTVLSKVQIVSVRERRRADRRISST